MSSFHGNHIFHHFTVEQSNVINHVYILGILCLNCKFTRGHRVHIMVVTIATLYPLTVESTLWNKFWHKTTVKSSTGVTTDRSVAEWPGATTLSTSRDLCDPILPVKERDKLIHHPRPNIITHTHPVIRGRSRIWGKHITLRNLPQPFGQISRSLYWYSVQRNS